MNILLVAATEFEIAPSLSFLSEYKKEGINIQPCITGVGMVATTYHLTRNMMEQQHDFILQIGVAGAFNRQLSLGEIVLVAKDQFADLGAEDKGAYLDIFEMDLIKSDEFPFTSKTLINPLVNLPQKLELPIVNAITVNTVSGHQPTIEKRYKKSIPDIESMEGAALHYVGLQMGVPFAQIRAISNYVEPRDKSTWQMKKAIHNLNEWLINFIKSW